LSWICILLMIFIVLEKQSMTNSPIFTLRNLNFFRSAWSCCFFAVVFLYTFLSWNPKYSWRFSYKECFQHWLVNLLEKITFFSLKSFNHCTFILVFYTFIIVDLDGDSIISWEIICQYSLGPKKLLLTCTNDHNEHQNVKWMVE
jgi:hypothetical protein